MENNRPTVRAEVTFLSEQDGGRRTLPTLTSEYRPHIVVQSADVRTATADEDGLNRERYLGVTFLAPAGALCTDKAAEVTLELLYYPRVDYSELRAGATFTIREGGRIVGHGTVITSMKVGIAQSDYE